MVIIFARRNLISEDLIRKVLEKLDILCRKITMFKRPYVDRTLCAMHSALKSNEASR
jgi:hypothetical protein